MSIDLKGYGNSIIGRLFNVIDLTRDANTDTEYENIDKFISKLIVEVEGSIDYFNEVENGKLMTSVLMKLNGVKNIWDYNVRRKAMLDSIEIINKIIQNL